MAGVKVRELVTVFGFKANQGELDRIENGVLSLKKVIAATAAAGAAAAASVFGLAHNVSTTGDEIAKMSPIIGLSTDELQTWRHAANLAGLANEEFSTSVRFLSRGVADIYEMLQRTGKATGPYAEAFDLLGVQIMDTNGNIKSNQQLLEELAIAFQNVDPALRTGLAMDIFGRSGARMGSLLAQGIDAINAARQELRDMGAVLSPEDLKQSEKYVDAMTRLQASLLGIKNTVGAGLLPELQDLVDTSREWIVANGDLLRTRLRDFIKGLIALMQPFLKVTIEILNAFISLIERLGGFERIAKIAAGAVTLLIAAMLVQKVYAFASAVQFALFTVRYFIATEGAIKALTLAWATLGNTAFAAWIKTLGPFALVAIAIGAVILIVQDLITWFRGGESALTHLLGTVEEFGRKERQIIEAVAQWFRDIFSAVWEWLKQAGIDIAEFFGGIGETIAEAFRVALNAVIGGINAVIRAMNNIPGIDIPLIPKLQETPDVDADVNTGQGRQTGQQQGIEAAQLLMFPMIPMNNQTPLNPGSAAAAAGGKTENSVKVDSTINLQIPEGTKAEQAAFIREQVSKANQETWDQMLDHTAANFARTG